MHDLALAGEPWDGDWYCRAPVTAIERLWGVARVLRFQVRARSWA